ncbi:MAG: hypothetical protein IKI76_08100 [Selenomonadaceae bacterium]|nr:hypothetical protein [Selenomonadaceae bacterium]
MNLIKEIFSGSKTFHITIFLASVLFLYLFSYSTSPLYSSWGVDSAIFQVGGKGWAEGLLPYVNNFENKGPLLFAINALGYLIYPREGIFILQIPFMYFSFLFMWRAVELYWSRRATLIIFAAMILWRASVFTEGNRTEEYSMPFLLAAAYFFLRGLKTSELGKIFCPPIVGFVYGLGFGACVLLRTTNGLPICCYVFLTLIFLLQAHDFKKICQNVLSFLAGFAIICLPFVIYFAAHGALYDMLYGTILFNTKLATTYSDDSTEHLKYMVGYAVIHFGALYLLIFASICLLKKNLGNKLAWSGLFIGITMFFLLVRSRPFVMYLELIAAVLPILFAVLHEWKCNVLPTIKNSWHMKGFTSKRIFWKFIAVITSLYVLFQSALLVDHFYTANSTENQERFLDKMNDMQKLGSYIKPQERTSVVFYGEGNIMSYFILETGIYPRCRFFSNITNAFGLYDSAVIAEWVQNVKSDYPKWILYSALEKEYTGEEIEYWDWNFRRQRHPAVEEILADRYTLVGLMELYGQIINLYRLKD